MADQSSSNASKDMEAHRGTYDAFLTGAVALSILVGYIMVALVAFRFAHSLNVFSGFTGLILGIIAVLIDVRSSGKWYLSVGLLVVFGLITAVNVS